MRGIGCMLERVFGEVHDDSEDGDVSVEDGVEGEKVCGRSVWN